MKSFELIQMLTKQIIPVERCGTATFETSNLSELSIMFGTDYNWSGYMSDGNIFYVYVTSNDDFILEEWDLIGFSRDCNGDDILVFFIEN